MTIAEHDHLWVLEFARLAAIARREHNTERLMQLERSRYLMLACERAET